MPRRHVTGVQERILTLQTGLLSVLSSLIVERLEFNLRPLNALGRGTSS